MNRVLPAGDDERIVDIHLMEARQRRLIATLTVAIALPVVTVIVGVVIFYTFVVSLLVGDRSGTTAI